MLLTVDIGNTNIVAGVFDRVNVVTVWRLATQSERMADEWWATMSMLAAQEEIDLRQITGAIVASGVPRLTATFADMLQRRLGLSPLIVDSQIELGLRILTDNPREVGADRLANAVAAHARYSGPCVVVDCGTATTFDVVSVEGDYLGGAIAPGIAVALEALTSRAARLTAVDLALPPHAIGKNTIHSVQSGTVLGYIALIEGLLARIGKELDAEPTVIGTGGLVSLLAEHTTAIQYYEPNLTLEGLRLIYQRLRGE